MQAMRWPIESFPPKIPVEELSPADISKAKILVNQFKRWAAEVDKRAMELSNAGQEIPGFERKFRLGAKKDATGEEIEKVIGEMPQYTAREVFLAAGELNLKKCVNMVRDKSPRGLKQIREDEFLDALRDADIGQPQGGYYYLKPKPGIYDEKIN